MNTMTAVHAARLHILANFVEGKDLDMRNYVHDCGSPSCALGWARTIPALQGIGDLDAINSRVLFGLTLAENEGLFYSAAWHNYWGRNNVTGKEWAAKAREILAAHGYPTVAEPIELPTETLEGVVQLEYSALLQRLTAPVRVRG